MVLGTSKFIELTVNEAARGRKNGNEERSSRWYYADDGAYGVCWQSGAATALSSGRRAWRVRTMPRVRKRCRAALATAVHIHARQAVITANLNASARCAPESVAGFRLGSDGLAGVFEAVNLMGQSAAEGGAFVRMLHQSGGAVADELQGIVIKLLGAAALASLAEEVFAGVLAAVFLQGAEFSEFHVGNSAFDGSGTMFDFQKAQHQCKRGDGLREQSLVGNKQDVGAAIPAFQVAGNAPGPSGQLRPAKQIDIPILTE